MELSSRLLTVAETCDYLGVTRDTWTKWRAKGTSPAAIRLPNGSLRIPAEELASWLTARSRC